MAGGLEAGVVENRGKEALEYFARRDRLRRWWGRGARSRDRQRSRTGFNRNQPVQIERSISQLVTAPTLILAECSFDQVSRL